MAHSASKHRKLSPAAAAADGDGDGDGGKEELELEEEQPLLPGLPDHLAHLCLSLVPPALLYSVCHPWRRLIYSPSFPSFLSLYALLHSPDDESIGFYSIDPISAVWAPLPAPPPHPPLHRLLLRHPSFIARSLPVQSVSVSGHLVLLAATTHRLQPAFHRPLVFHPASLRWRIGPPIPTPRRWCAAGAAGGCVYLASGVGLEYSADVARSAERWDPSRLSGWERVASLRDCRFSREATDAVASRGKLCMVNVKGGRGPKEGAVYDVRSDRWEEMPPGLLSGWTGPAAAEPGGGPIYSVDEASGALRVYDWKGDRWRVVVESERLKGAVQAAAGGGRICVTCRGGAYVVVVDVAAKPARLWVVDPPHGKRVVALHVLPRMSRTES